MRELTNIPERKTISSQDCRKEYWEEVVPIFEKIKRGAEWLVQFAESNHQVESILNRYIKDNSIRRGVSSDGKKRKYSVIFWLDFAIYLKKQKNISKEEREIFNNDFDNVIKEIKKNFFEIYSRYYNFAIKVAKKTSGYDELTDDQKEYIAVKKLESSIAAFKIANGKSEYGEKKLAGFAKFLKGNIRRELKRVRSSLYYSRSSSDELLRKIDRFIEEYKKTNNGEKPSMKLISDELSARNLSLKPNDIRRIINSRNSQRSVYGRGISLGDIFPNGMEKDNSQNALFPTKDNSPEYSVRRREVLALIDSALVASVKESDFDELQKAILKHRLLGDNSKTLDEIGKKYNVSAERVRQVQVELIKKIEKFLKERNIRRLDDIL